MKRQYRNVEDLAREQYLEIEKQKEKYEELQVSTCNSYNFCCAAT